MQSPVQREGKLVGAFEDSSLDHFRGRLKCYTLFDLVLGVAVTLGSLVIWMSNSDEETRTLHILSMSVGGLFLFDACASECLLIKSRGTDEDSGPAAGTSYRNLKPLCILNMIGNLLTVAMYVVIHAVAIGDMGLHSRSGATYGMIYVFVVIAKFLKLTTLVTFFSWVREQERNCNALVQRHRDQVSARVLEGF